MTDNLNEKIAEKKGWKENPNGCDLGVGNDVNFKFVSPDGKGSSRLPDNTRDGRLTCELLEEIVNKGYPNEVEINKHCVEGMGFNLLIRRRDIFILAPSIGEAIALAWWAVFGGGE